MSTMRAKGAAWCAAITAALALPGVLLAQSRGNATDSSAPARSDTAKPVHVCIDCGGVGRRLDSVAYLITDPAGKPLVLVGPADSLAAAGLDPDDVGQVRVVKPDQPVTDVGAVFHNGVVVIVLSSRGMANWASRRSSSSDSTRSIRPSTSR